ncbi:methyltransferase domain-containing protein [Luteolibacter flavescens]|uniref:Methyltransferase domain-containing protein n=1 Tax=Luteolibacter flavescens TaxID=1859460 RepID=A0ABT3FQK1_9BACT|nr:methyltransferase domain-containing protein [Luteolibacter flavescens]MCW1885853.1 methyltransferase domain-containing protein [Luteolibacter flavescens]
MAPTDETGGDVASHYDELDPVYRSLWGEHVHHGLWETGSESPLEAVAKLSRHVATRAAIKAGDRVCDVGCGYGATARMIAAEYGAQVTGITISPKQHAAAAATAGHGTDFVLGDWMRNDFPCGSFDVVIAIESTEHLPDVARGIAEMARVLVPGGRVVISAWMASSAPREWQRRHLLDPVRREGRLSGMGAEEDYQRWIADAGLELRSAEDLSKKVRRTWPATIRQTIAGFFRDAGLRRYLLKDHPRNLAFALTLLRVWLAYLTGAMRYVVFTAEKPHEK